MVAKETAMTKYSQTEYNRHKRVMAGVRDLWSQARAFKLTCDAVIEAHRALTESHDYKRLTPYYRGFVNGAYHTLWDAHWRDAVRWQLYVDGNPRTSEEISAMREAGDVDVWQRVTGAHIYKDGGKLFNIPTPVTSAVYSKALGKVSAP
jgi:hypothetical protein